MDVKNIYFTVPHEESKITFRYPSFTGFWQDVAEKISNIGLEIPSSSETASIIFNAFQNKRGEYESKIIKILDTRWYWEFTGNLYLPKSNSKINNGVILDLKQRPNKNRQFRMNKDSLIKKLYNDDPLVKFVPFGFKTGKQTTGELEKNPYVIARYGEEGAHKIAEIASEYRNDPELHITDSFNGEVAKKATLYNDYKSMLAVGDCVGGDGGDSFAIEPNKEFLLNQSKQ
jgi:hypothetical protein